MIECVFTVDYEIFGDGTGSTKELMYEPAQKMKSIFDQYGVPFVLFVEVAELEILERAGTDASIDLVKRQVQDFHHAGIEVGLHIHPQWYNARRQDGEWLVDFSEYNMCTFPEHRIAEIVDRGLAHLRRMLEIPDYTPLSYRAGALLFQPSQTIARVLAERGIKLDSSVYKGGMRQQPKLNYRAALKNGYYWRFDKDAATPDLHGILLEIPVYSKMVPAWKLLTKKRLGLEAGSATVKQTGKKIFSRLNDFIHFRRPLKFDFCSMGLDELTSMVDRVLKEDRKDPGTFRPIVAIGHTKELVDFETVKSFLAYLRSSKIKVSTFRDIYDRGLCG
jgi:hypothetical protein